MDEGRVPARRATDGLLSLSDHDLLLRIAGDFEWVIRRQDGVVASLGQLRTDFDRHLGESGVRDERIGTLAGSLESEDAKVDDIVLWRAHVDGQLSVLRYLVVIMGPVTAVLVAALDYLSRNKL